MVRFPIPATMPGGRRRDLSILYQVLRWLSIIISALAAIYCVVDIVTILVALGKGNQSSNWIVDIVLTIIGFFLCVLAVSAYYRSLRNWIIVFAWIQVGVLIYWIVKGYNGRLASMIIGAAINFLMVYLISKGYHYQ